MTIHSAADLRDIDQRTFIVSSCSWIPKNLISCIDMKANPYFMSYPHLALTLLIHPTRHTLLKIILHSNLPGQANFGRTTRADWIILAASPTSPGTQRAERGCRQKWKSIKDVLGTEEEEGVIVLDRGVEAGEGLKGDIGLTGTSLSSSHLLVRRAHHETCGGGTDIHGFPGIAFEVTKQDLVETVFIF